MEWTRIYSPGGEAEQFPNASPVPANMLHAATARRRSNHRYIQHGYVHPAHMQPHGMPAAQGIVKRDFDRTAAGGRISLFVDVGFDDSTPINATVFMLDNPIVQGGLLSFMLGLGLSGLVRLFPAPALTSLVPPVIFVTSYVATYQQVPTFPPVGAVNKIFYIAWWPRWLDSSSTSLGPQSWTECSDWSCWH